MKLFHLILLLAFPFLAVVVVVDAENDAKVELEGQQPVVDIEQHLPKANNKRILGKEKKKKAKKKTKKKKEAAVSKTKRDRQRPGGLNFFKDPPLPSVCAAKPPQNPKIPKSLLLKKKKLFETNGGTILLTDNCPTDEQCGPYIVDMIQKQPNWVPYPTPEYEEDRTPPEPYPFRTALPILSSLRCNVNQMPYVVFIPNTNHDAAEAIKLIHHYNEEFAILSGGHDYECQSSTQSALIITSLLNKIDFDFDEYNPSVTAGAGVLWSNIYDRLKGMNSRFGVMGAQCGLVSVSGYTAGGGYSWHMSRYYGISAENVLEVTAVLANGKIVTATPYNEYRDLRWAICGSGGQNLAFILEWKFRMFHSPLGGFTHSRVEYRFDNIESVTYDESDRPIYPWTMAREILKDSVVASNELLDKDEIGTVQVRYRKYRGNGQQYSLEINTPCRNDHPVNDVTESCLADQEHPSLVELKEKYAPYRVRYEYYPLLADFLLRRTNSYPSTRNSDRGSHFISGPPDKLRNLVDESLDYFDPTYDTEPDPTKITSYFPDFNWYGLKDIIKNRELTSINSEAWKASWHVTSRARYSDTDALYDRIKCYIRGWNSLVEHTMTDYYYHGTYINYLDGTAAKSTYYGTNLPRLLQIKKEYDPTNFYKRVKGIAVNDVDVDCLDDVCGMIEEG